MILGLAWWAWILCILGGALLGELIAVGLAVLVGLAWAAFDNWRDRRRWRRC